MMQVRGASLSLLRLVNGGRKLFMRFGEFQQLRPKLIGCCVLGLMPVGEQPAAHGSRVCRVEAPSVHRHCSYPPPHLVKGNPAKRTQRGTLVAAFRYCLPAASRTASLALPTPLRM
jgi:hypothetical protein